MTASVTASTAPGRHERDGRAAEPAAGHPRAERAVRRPPPRTATSSSAHGDLVVVAQRGVRGVEQRRRPPRPGPRASSATVSPDPLDLGDDVPRPAPDTGRRSSASPAPRRGVVGDLAQRSATPSSGARPARTHARRCAYWPSTRACSARVSMTSSARPCAARSNGTCSTRAVAAVEQQRVAGSCSAATPTGPCRRSGRRAIVVLGAGADRGEPGAAGVVVPRPRPQRSVERHRDRALERGRATTARRPSGTRAVDDDVERRTTCVPPPARSAQSDAGDVGRPARRARRARRRRAATGRPARRSARTTRARCGPGAAGPRRRCAAAARTAGTARRCSRCARR